LQNTDALKNIGKAKLHSPHLIGKIINIFFLSLTEKNNDLYFYFCSTEHPTCRNGILGTGGRSHTRSFFSTSEVIELQGKTM